MLQVQHLRRRNLQARGLDRRHDLPGFSSLHRMRPHDAQGAVVKGGSAGEALPVGEVGLDLIPWNLLVGGVRDMATGRAPKKIRVVTHQLQCHHWSIVVH
eukprot:Skav222334  [mRNA]  locus=scaffold3590:13664:31371:- [translate_table: standard]